MDNLRNKNYTDKPTHIINSFIGLVLTKRAPFLNVCAFLDVPLDDLNLRYPYQAEFTSAIASQRRHDHTTLPSPTSCKT